MLSKRQSILQKAKCQPINIGRYLLQHIQKHTCSDWSIYEKQREILHVCMKLKLGLIKAIYEKDMSKAQLLITILWDMFRAFIKLNEKKTYAIDGIYFTHSGQHIHFDAKYFSETDILQKFNTTLRTSICLIEMYQSYGSIYLHFQIYPSKLLQLLRKHFDLTLFVNIDKHEITNNLFNVIKKDVKNGQPIISKYNTIAEKIKSDPTVTYDKLTINEKKILQKAIIEKKIDMYADDIDKAEAFLKLMPDDRNFSTFAFSPPNIPDQVSNYKHALSFIVYIWKATLKNHTEEFRKELLELLEVTPAYRILFEIFGKPLDDYYKNGTNTTSFNTPIGQISILDITLSQVLQEIKLFEADMHIKLKRNIFMNFVKNALKIES